MSQSLYKIARKSSADPAQEQLRQHKDAWNSATKALISKLIAFKRGLNGRGDAKIGLPPSDIKNPFPSEIGAFLNEVAQDYNRVVDDAYRIIQEQAGYSNSRRKTVETSLKDEALIVEASWWGSRLWSRVSLRKLDQTVRKHRLRLIKDGLDLGRELKQFENELLKNQADSIPNAIVHISVFGDFVKLFMENYDDLIAQMLIIEGLGVVLPKEDSKALPGKESVEESLNDPNTAILTKFEQMWLDRVNVKAVIKSIMGLPAMEVNKSTIQSALDEFDTLLHAFNSIIKTPPIKINSEVLAARLEKLQNLYDYLFTVAQKALGEGKSFIDLVSRIAPAVEDKNNELEKIADSAVKKWLQKQKLQFNSNNQDRLILDMIALSEKCRKSLENVLNQLESSKSSLEQIDTATINFITDIKIILEKMSKIGDIYLLSNRRKRDKEHPIVRKDELKKLMDISRELDDYLKPVSDLKK